MNWVEQQKRTRHHKLAVILFPLVIFLAYINPVVYCLGLVLFFLVTSFKLLKRMLIWMILLGTISFIFPFLMPVLIIVMIIFFIMKISYIIKNWKPFLAGWLLYGCAGVLAEHSFHMYVINFQQGLPLFSHFVESLFMVTLSYFVIKLILIGLYKSGYSSYEALGIMGSVPIIIISLILPFLKLFVGTDTFASPDHVGYGHTVADGNISVDGVHAQGHDVNGYVRTAPDGDPTNNLSYKGPNPSPVNPDKLFVHGYSTASSTDPAQFVRTESSGFESIARASVVGQGAVDSLISELRMKEKAKDDDGK